MFVVKIVKCRFAEIAIKFTAFKEHFLSLAYNINVILIIPDKIFCFLQVQVSRVEKDNLTRIKI